MIGVAPWHAGPSGRTDKCARACARRCCGTPCILVTVVTIAAAVSLVVLLDGMVLAKRLHASYVAVRPDLRSPLYRTKRHVLLRRVPSRCPAVVPDQPYLAVVSVFKNEADVMAEWFDHHLWQGVDHFFLVDNGSTDSYADVIAAYADCVTVVYDARRHAQLQLLNSHLLPLAKPQSRWMMHIDMDEFVYASRAHGFSSIADVLNFVDLTDPAATHIRFLWQFMGSSGHIQQPPTIREHFTRAGSTFDRMPKWVARSAKVKEIGVHAPLIDVPDQRDARLRPVSWVRHSLFGEPLAKFPPAEAVLRINHYSTMSWERFQRVKMTRGDVAGAKYETHRDKSYFDEYDKLKGDDVDNVELQQLVRQARAVHCGVGPQGATVSTGQGRFEAVPASAACLTRPKGAPARLAVATVVPEPPPAEPVLLEWVRHYLWQGVGQVYLVDQSAAGTVAQQLAPHAPCVTVVRDATRLSMAQALDAHVLPLVRAEAKWVLAVPVTDFVYARPSVGFSLLLDIVRYADQAPGVTRVLVRRASVVTLPAGVSGQLREASAEAVRAEEATTRLQRTSGVASFDAHIAMVKGGGELDARLLPSANPVVFPPEDAALAVIRYRTNSDGARAEPLVATELLHAAAWQRMLHCVLTQ